MIGDLDAVLYPEFKLRLTTHHSVYSILLFQVYALGA